MRTVVMAGAALVALMTAAGPAAADVKAGVDAWQRGDYRTAVDQWRPLAIAGDADAEYNLGQAYKLGRGVPVDPVLAESWFGKAAAQGHERAEENYGIALFQDGKKGDAVPWLEKAVGRDAPRAELVYGTMLFNGDGVPRDYPRAYALMVRAAASRGGKPGLPSASETLAQMDQYISSADRERGTALAQQYAVHATATQIADGSDGLRPADLPPSTVNQPTVDRAPRAGRPAPIDRRRPPAAMPAAADTAGDTGDRAARPAFIPPHPAPDRAAMRDRPAPRPAPPRAAAGGGWRVQLGAFGDAGNAHALWSRVAGRFPGASAIYGKAGAMTRLQAGPYRSRAEAQRACAAAHVTCVVVAP